MVYEIVTARIEYFESIFLDHRTQFLFTAPTSGDLCFDVANPFLGRAHVRFDHLKQGHVALAAMVQFNRRYTKPFLKCFVPLTAETAGKAAAYIRMMGIGQR